MKTIRLTQGKVAIVDDDDFDFLSQWKWCARRCAKRGRQREEWYAVHNHYEDGRQHTWMMHRIITQAIKGEKVDHKNHDGLDNRRDNLRVTDDEGNARNSLPHSDGTSRFRGVYWYKPRRKWKANISINGKQTYLGLFATEEAAAMAYNNAAIRLFGEFACLNEISTAA